MAILVCIFAYSQFVTMDFLLYVVHVITNADRAYNLLQLKRIDKTDKKGRKTLIRNAPRIG